VPALRQTPIALALLALAVGGSGCASGDSAGASLRLPSAKGVPRSATSHVVVVVLENRELSDVIANRAAPYLNSLARRGALATRYFAIDHPSLPNYLALTGGRTFGVTTDCTGCRVSGPNLVDQLTSAGASWKVYMEDLPAPCSTVTSAGGYSLKHNPFLYYRGLRADPSRCRSVVPATELGGDLRAGRLADFSWISPNLCHDGHDCSLRTSDRFLRQLVPPLLAALGPHGFLAVLWDEGTSDAGCCRLASGGRVPAILLGPDVRAGGRLAVRVDHYSALRTIEDAFGLAHLANAACACTASLDGLFRTPPRGLPGRPPAHAPARRPTGARSR